MIETHRLKSVVIFIQTIYEQIYSRLVEIFMMIPEIAFAGLSVMTIAYLLQLPPVRGKVYFLIRIIRNIRLTVPKLIYICRIN